MLAFWGAQLAGAVVVPVNTRFKDSEAQYVIDDSGTASEERVDMLTSVPAIYHALTRHPAFADTDLGAVKFVSYGGAPIAASAVDQIMQAFPQARVGNGFGLTETSSLTSYLPHEEATEHADSVGFAMPVCDVAIGGPDPETGVGELLVRGPNVVQGYWNKPDATAETFVDGWLHTGDLGRIDDDGLLYIVDRKKDMINRGGENVYSIEVERARWAARRGSPRPRRLASPTR